MPSAPARQFAGPSTRAAVHFGDGFSRLRHASENDTEGKHRPFMCPLTVLYGPGVLREGTKAAWPVSTRERVGAGLERS